MLHAAGGAARGAPPGRLRVTPPQQTDARPKAWSSEPLHGRRFVFLRLLPILVLIQLAATALDAKTFVVEMKDGSGAALSTAIMSANELTGSGVRGPHTILFVPPAASGGNLSTTPVTLTINTPLPEVTSEIVLLAPTLPPAESGDDVFPGVPRPLVVLDGSALVDLDATSLKLTSIRPALHLLPTAAGSRISGLGLRGFRGSGVRVAARGAVLANLTISETAVIDPQPPPNAADSRERGSAVVIAAEAVTATRLQLTNNDNHGVLVRWEGSSATIEDCVIAGNKGNGVAVLGDNALVQRSLIGATAARLLPAASPFPPLSQLPVLNLLGTEPFAAGNQRGVLIENVTFGAVLQNRILFNKDTGVFLSAALGVNIVDNDIFDSVLGDGIGILSSSSLTGIHVNRIGGNGDHGITFRSSSASIYHNAIGWLPDLSAARGNGHGILATAISSLSAIANNTVGNNRFVGILCQGDSMQITDNVVGLHPLDDREMPNSLGGIRVESSAADFGTKVIRNVVSGNGFANIIVGSGRKLEISDNLIGTTANGESLPLKTAASMSFMRGIVVSNPLGRTTVFNNVIIGMSAAALEVTSPDVSIEGNLIGLTHAQRLRLALSSGLLDAGYNTDPATAYAVLAANLDPAFGNSRGIEISGAARGTVVGDGSLNDNLVRNVSEAFATAANVVVQTKSGPGVLIQSPGVAFIGNLLFNNADSHQVVVADEAGAALPGVPSPPIFTKQISRFQHLVTVEVPAAGSILFGVRIYANCTADGGFSGPGFFQLLQPVQFEEATSYTFLLSLHPSAGSNAPTLPEWAFGLSAMATFVSESSIENGGTSPPAPCQPLVPDTGATVLVFPTSSPTARPTAIPTPAPQAGPAPSPPPSPSSSSSSSSPLSGSTAVILGVVAALVVVGGGVLVCLTMTRRKSSHKQRMELLGELTQLMRVPNLRAEELYADKFAGQLGSVLDNRLRLQQLTEEIRVHSDQVLGEGEHGRVLMGHLVRNSSGGGGMVAQVPVAVKMLHEGQFTGSDCVQLLLEARVMAMLEPHPHVVSLLAAQLMQAPVMLALEFCNAGNLRDWLRNAPRSGDARPLAAELRCLCLHVARGMDFLHSNMLVHRDLAARNVLLARADSGGGRGLTAKLGDLGLTRSVAGDSDYYRKTSDGAEPVKWMCPIAIALRRFSKKSDVWSFGVLVWEIYTLGAAPYENFMASEVVVKVNQGYRLPQPEGCPEDIHSMMQACWRRDETARPSFAALVARLGGGEARPAWVSAEAADDGGDDDPGSVV